jgi:hypothetical protein
LTVSLYSTISSIERFSRKEISRGALFRLVRNKTDLGKIQEYRDTLRRSLDLFGVGLKHACATELSCSNATPHFSSSLTSPSGRLPLSSLSSTRRYSWSFSAIERKIIPKRQALPSLLPPRSTKRMYQLLQWYPFRPS